VSEFLAEVIGAPFPGDPSPALSAARQDAKLMNEEIRAAFVELLAADCHANAVLLLLEDLHWGDAATVRALDRTLRELNETPLFVLALARPEIHERFPKLWAGRPLQEIRLRELPKKAAEELARHVLGEGAQPSAVDRIVSLSAGNAFYLEELIRATAEGKTGDLPDSIMAMVQSRLGALDDQARHILRAASIFGETFWSGGLKALLAPATPAALEPSLEFLESRDILLPRTPSRFPGEREFVFGHVLLRDGAYALLTDADTAIGHKLAGAWLESAGEADAMILASHYELGGEADRAAKWCLAVAEQAFERDELDTAVTTAERGLQIARGQRVDGEPPRVDPTLLAALERVERLAKAHQDEIGKSPAPVAAPSALPESSYRFSIVPGTQIFIEICAGRWSKDFTRRYVAEFKETVAPLLGRPWGKLCDLNAWMPTEPDAAETIIDFLKWSIEQRMTFVAYVISNPDARLQARRIIESSNVAVMSGFFATEGEGLIWLRENGLG
jgi:hypothetical protein